MRRWLHIRRQSDMRGQLDVRGWLDMRGKSDLRGRSDLTGWSDVRGWSDMRGQLDICGWSDISGHLDIRRSKNRNIFMSIPSHSQTLNKWKKHQFLSSKSGWNCCEIKGGGGISDIFKIAHTMCQVFYILVASLIQLFLNQLIIRIYHFEVNMLMHLNFCDPAVKFFLDHPKKLHWNIDLDDLVGVGGWVFPGHPLKFSPFC